MAQVNPRRHYWHIIRAHSLLGAALKSILDHLHPSDSDDDPVNPPPQVIVANEAKADGVVAQPGSVIVVKAGGVPSMPDVTPPIAAQDLLPNS